MKEMDGRVEANEMQRAAENKVTIEIEDHEKKGHKSERRKQAHTKISRYGRLNAGDRRNEKIDPRRPAFTKSESDRDVRDGKVRG